ncbi:MAG: hypothetical protein NC184_05915 [Roseburia sp.]|nr:hypothetical protein [Roseburia sp.]
MLKLLKRNSFISVIVAIVALVASALAFSMFFSARSYAEGNDALRPGGGYDIRLELDANGRDAEDVEALRDISGADTGTGTVAANNASHIKKRMIASSVVVERYNAAHRTQQDFTELNSGDGYTFVAGSIKNDSSAYDVTFDVDRSFLYVTANSYTAGGYFSVQLSASSHPEPVSVYFSVQVHDTFAQLAHQNNGGWSDLSDSDKSLYVGNKLNDQALEATASFADGKHASVLSIYNNSKVTIDLSELLLGRALYGESKTPGAAAGQYATSIKMGGLGNKLWSISSVTNFKIDSIEYVDKTAQAILTNPTASKRVTPTATMNVALTASDINLYTGAEYSDIADPSERLEKFWSSTHEMKVTLSLVNATGITSNDPTSYVVKIPVVFYPANPQVKDVGSSVLSLNVKSEYGYDISENKYYDLTGKYTYTGTDDSGNPVEKPIQPTAADGYSSVILRPSDIIEYSYPTTAYGGIMRFIIGECDSSTSDYKIEKLESDTNAERPEALKITALSNGSYNIKFVVEYRAGVNSRQKKEVTVTVTGYGHYAITLPSLNGKKAVSYNILSASEFAALRNDGYQMTSAESLNPDQLAVTLSDNMLTLDPNVGNIPSGQTKAQVKLTFTNYNSQSVVITTNEFNIDVKAGSFWSRFEDWQGWLIIAACVLGGIILILFIVWVFIHSISKHKQAELATQAPVSSYIVKLNSSIAATQAQQRMAATQALSQASTQMLLSAGPTGTGAPVPDMLQLASGIPSQPAPMESMPPQTDSAPKEEQEEDINALIAKYITDEELLERIFTEKYEPKGMVRRTFFKSKDLQARELEKEKKRITERYKTPMPMDEAIMSENDINKKAERLSTPSTPSMPSQPGEERPGYLFVLGFDPDDPLYVPSDSKDEFSEEKIDIDASPEEAALKSVELQNDIIMKELEELKARLDKVQSEMSRITDYDTDLRARIAQAEADDAQYQKDIEDLEFKLASAKNKDKDKITRDIKIKEEQKERNLDLLERLREELEGSGKSKDTLSEILEKLAAMYGAKQSDQQGIAANLDKAQADYAAYQDRLAKVKARQELDEKVEGLSPLLVAVNTADFELRELEAQNAKFAKDREDLKSEVAAAKSQILGATDFDVINDLNIRIADANVGLSDLEKVITKTTKRKSELNIEFNTQRRKANEFVEKNEIPLEEVIAAEDIVIGNIELDRLKAEREQFRDEAEQNVAKAQAVYDDLSASSHDVTMIAMEVAAGIKDLEDELEEAKAALDAVNAQMETASDDEKLLLMVEQGDKSDKIDELNEKIKQANVDGTKRKMEAQSEYDAQLEEARKALDEANEEFRAACAKYDELANNTNPVDLIVSGSGIISQDQKKFEAENLKKQLDKSKNEIEQARLAAQMAQMEAEQARIDAEHATDEAKAEAERKLQEALAAAEAARLEAEEKARSEIEAAERAKAEAEESAERAKQEAEEAAERARLEAEEAAERAKAEAEEAFASEAEEARRKALEESEEARRQAQEEIEEMRRKSEEEAEAKRLAEETRRKEEEERQKADDERRALIAKKIQIRKEQIIAVRNKMKDIKDEDEAKAMREQLYTSQLSFDEDERGSTELMDFYNKTMDDIQSAGEIAKLKAENAKKPQRVIKKVTERVNRIPRKKAKPGTRTGARPSASRSGARPAGSARSGARPSASRNGVRAGSARPAARPGARPTTSARPRPSGTRPPSGNRPK